MRELTAELAASLGADTAGLAMRVGLHSGTMMGGVLRGQKSRFHFFGDTMNTASRMESNGAPGRIHVSLETALELEVMGKSSWITRRPDTITAKGKGKLQTFWEAPCATSDGHPSTVTDSSLPYLQRPKPTMIEL